MVWCWAFSGPQRCNDMTDINLLLVTIFPTQLKTYLLHFQLSESLSRLAEHYIANTRPYTTMLPICSCRIQRLCNTELLIQMLSLQHSWAEQQRKIFSLSPVIVGKCRICQHFLQLHGLHKRPGLLFELMCCVPLCCGVEAACTSFSGSPTWSRS